RYVALMKSLVARTRNLFQSGLPLAGQVDPSLRVDIELFSRGGLAILDAIESAGYNTLQRRPALSKTTKLRLVGHALSSKLLGSSTREVPANRLPSSGVSERSPSVNVRLTTSPEVVAASYVECNRIARAAKSSFYLAFFGLPRQKRNSLCALYAFMRL